MSAADEQSRLTAGGLNIQVPTLNPAQLVRTSEGAPVLAHLDPNNKVGHSLLAWLKPRNELIGRPFGSLAEQGAFRGQHSARHCRAHPEGFLV
eukprot:scaffold7052_cov254-Pinguiococcus_pyrenoidosus.AAC.23